MIAVYLSPLYLLLNLYLAFRLLSWMRALSPRLGKKRAAIPAAILYAAFALSPAIAFFLPAGTPARRILELTGNYWLGILLYAALFVGAADLLRLLLRRFCKSPALRTKRAHTLTGAVCILLTAAVSVYGIRNAGIIRTTPYEVTVDKQAGSLSQLRVVLAADLHLGYTVGVSRMEQMVEKINREDPDLVVLAGDIFDNDYDALDDPEKLAALLKSIRSRYGVYACYGNHDVAEPILAGFTFGGADGEKASDPRMDELLEQAGIRLLRDETVLIGGSFYLCGRADYSRPGRGIQTRLTPAQLTQGLDRSKPILVLDHEPKELQELADAGADVDLCGHTHDGQVFPGNLITRLLWENSCGCLRKDAMYHIVTSGVGLFGPNMRVGTRAEICPVTIRFR